MKLGVFDSGHGGLDYLYAAMRQNLATEYFYCADMAYMPYGHCQNDILLERARLIISEFIKWGADIVVIACNTATAATIDIMRKEFSIPLIGVEPFINYVNKSELTNAPSSIGIMVTPSTFESERFNQLIKRVDPQGITEPYAMMHLAASVEKLIAQKDLKSFKDELDVQLLPLKNRGWDKVILGCTHYQLVSEFIATGLNIGCIEATQAIIGQTERIKNENNLKSSSIATDDFIYWNTCNKSRDLKKITDFIFWR